SYSEPYPVAFTGIAGQGSGAKIAFKPIAGQTVTTTIGGSTALNYGILIDSTSWMTFDGSNSYTAATRNWTINLTSPSVTSNVFQLQDGSNDTLENMKIN